MKQSLSLLLALLGCIGCPTLLAQVTIEQGFTAEQYVNDVLLGDGVSASNVTFIGELVQLARMTDESGSFSVSEGLVLSCGDPNRLSDCQVDANPTGLGAGFTDVDLLDVANSVPPLIGQTFSVSSVQDGCVLDLRPRRTLFPFPGCASNVETLKRLPRSCLRCLHFPGNILLTCFLVP